MSEIKTGQRELSKEQVERLRKLLEPFAQMFGMYCEQMGPVGVDPKHRIEFQLEALHVQQLTALYEALSPEEKNKPLITL